MNSVVNFGYKKLVFLIAGLVCFNLCSQEERFIRIEQHTPDVITVGTLYGIFTVDEPVLIELFNCPQMKRLEKIQQLGVYGKFSRNYNFNRYEHSVGVWALVRRFGGSLQEQVAALLHDVSHTAFSHVGGFVFIDTNLPDAAARMDAYQDDEHEQYLYESGVAAILKRHGLSVADIYHKNSAFKILEQNLPDMCADRFEYNIQGALWEGLLTREQAESIIENVHYEHGFWYFVSRESARQFALVSMIMTRTIWGSAENYITGIWLADALRRAVSLGSLTFDDIRFSDDLFVWSALENSPDVIIKNNLEKIVNVRNYFVCNHDQFDQVIINKFRGVDPLVQTRFGLERLTKIDADFAQEYYKMKRTMQHGWYVQNLIGSVA